MSFVVLVVLGVVQGLTEFLPVSSSGHLVLLYNLFGIENDVVLLSVLLHIATLFAVIVYYRKELLLLTKKPFCQTNKKIAVTTIFTVAVVLLIKPLLYKTFAGDYLIISFALTAFVLFISDYVFYRRYAKSKVVDKMSSNANTLSQSADQLTKSTNIHDLDISFPQAIIIGLTQGVACIPGISRSGSTIGVARLLGVRYDSATYSFLISIPIILASLALEIFEGRFSINVNVAGLIVSMLICFGLGLACIKVMTSFVKRNRLSLFGYYLLILATFLVLNTFVLHLF